MDWPWRILLNSELWTSSIAIHFRSNRGFTFNHDPLEAILVIFGHSSLYFFGLKALKNMKKDTFFVRMRSGDHLGDAKMSKKAPRSVEFNFFYYS